MNYMLPKLDEHNMFNAEDVQEYAVEFFKLNTPEATKIVGEQAIEIVRLRGIIRKLSSAASNATEAMELENFSYAKRG